MGKFISLHKENVGGPFRKSFFLWEKNGYLVYVRLCATILRMGRTDK